MKNKIITYSFVFVIGGFFLWNLIAQDQKISWSERRTLQQFPEISFKQIQNKTVMEQMEQYVLDQFVLREKFRSLKAHIIFDVFHQLDYNNIFIEDGFIFKSEYPNNQESITKFAHKIETIKQKYLKNNKVYYSIIPDKNYYLKSEQHLNLDYDDLYEQVISSFSDMEYIDLRNVLSLDDYYYTDTHWRQERLENVVNTLGKSMGFEIKSSYQKHSYAPFYGVYYGQAALSLKPDTLYYLTNEEIEQAIVSNYEKENVVYNVDKLGSMDSYDVFLSGSTPLVTIENPNQTNQKELIIFRDSYASSLAPLLIPAYSKITLIDLRYMTTSIMEELVSFQNQDVLFLYSTLLVNNSSSIKD